jgi:hypothetical protein
VPWREDADPFRAEDFAAQGFIHKEGRQALPPPQALVKVCLSSSGPFLYTFRFL